jgi:hypothetical protein
LCKCSTDLCTYTSLRVPWFENDAPKNADYVIIAFKGNY